MQKSTEMLINEIKTTDRIDSFISENTEEIQELSLSEYLRELLQKYDTGDDKWR